MNSITSKIKIPTLLINAKDDTFLSKQCYPWKLAQTHPLFHLEIPNYGGHVGFISFQRNGSIWSEERALSFVKD